MLFNSYGFIFIFFPIFMLIYWSLRSQDARKVTSLCASYVFYGAWSWKFAALMLGTTSIDFFAARVIDRQANQRIRKALLLASMTVNLGVLAIFKYYGFFANSVNAILPDAALPVANIVLPIGISFYTFESMSYTVDVYRRKVPALERFLDYAHFVTMFPRLVAGPIVRYRQLAEDLRQMPRRLSAEQVLEGLRFFTIGIGKKVIIADTLARHLVDPAFQQASMLKLVSSWAAASAYAGQLYFDFSGYSDMAVGLALLMGLRLPRNFQLPYAATNLIDFWRRWHISLSTWLRDYLYVPLGGNRKGTGRKYINMFLTMLLGGLWHGANWTFVVWGGYHGILLVFTHVAQDRSRFQVPRVLSISLTFVAVVIGWVIFRAESLATALDVYRAMSGMNGLGLEWVRPNIMILGLLAVALGLSFSIDTYELPPARQLRWTVVEAVVLALCVAHLAVPSPFLYFQF
jgi:alginate O-acetyltransferase complex protein AlgI